MARRGFGRLVVSDTFDDQYPVESKLLGIGSESYVVGSNEFRLGYAMTRGKMLCLDMGHFHPTESVADKVSTILTFSDELLVHISRGVRWSWYVPQCAGETTDSALAGG